MDQAVIRVKEFLGNPQQPAGFDSQKYKHFLRKVRDFFRMEDTLWRRDRQGEHRLVVSPENCMEIMTQVHNDLK
jgi:hypothetical protein